MNVEDIEPKVKKSILDMMSRIFTEVLPAHLGNEGFKNSNSLTILFFHYMQLSTAYNSYLSTNSEPDHRLELFEICAASSAAPIEESPKRKIIKTKCPICLF